jgi:UMP-CMP kinase family protein
MLGTSRLVSSILVVIGNCIKQHHMVINRTNRLFSSESVPKLKQQVIFVLGGPGSGKGTQCSKLSDEFGFVHLSAGELLRQERMKGTHLGLEIESFIKNGNIVPVSISLGLLKKEMESRVNANVFLIDGFPRNEDNLCGWDNLMSQDYQLTFALYLYCSETEMENRLLKRSLKSGRSDDKVDVIKKRFSIFSKETVPVLEILKQRECLVSICADFDEDKVFQSVRKAVLDFKAMHKK